MDIGKNTHFKWVWNLNAIGSIMVQCRNDPYLEHASVSYRRHTFETFLGGVTIVTPPKYFTFSFWFCNQHLRIFAQKVDIQVLKIRNDKFWPKILVKIILKGKKFKLTKNLRKYFWQTSGWSWNLVSCHFCVRSLQKLFDRHIFGKYFSLCGFSTYWRSLTVPKKCCKCKVNLSIGVKLAYFLAN